MNITEIFAKLQVCYVETNNFSQSPETPGDTSYFHSALHTSEATMIYHRSRTLDSHMLTFRPQTTLSSILLHSYIFKSNLLLHIREI